jgi:hypothetical protein
VYLIFHILLNGPWSAWRILFPPLLMNGTSRVVTNSFRFVGLGKVTIHSNVKLSPVHTKPAFSSNIPTTTPAFSLLMGKAKRMVRKVHTNHHDNPRHKSNGIVRRSHSLTVSKKSSSSKLQAQQAAAKAVARPRVPFNESDRVLCIGEGASIAFLLLSSRCAQSFDVDISC